MNTTATVDKKMFVDRLTTLGRIVYKGPTLPVLANIYVGIEDNFVTLRSTNLEIYERATMPAQTEGEPCAVTIPAYMMLKLLKKAPRSADTITLSIDMQDVALDVECGAMTLHLRGIDAEEFPCMPIVTAYTTLHLDPVEFGEALQQTLPATTTDEARQILCGVSFSTYRNNLGLAAADGFRLAVRKLPAKVEGKLDEVIIPAHALKELMREIEKHTKPVKMSACPTYVKFETETMTIISTITEGNFPDYKKIIPARCAIRVTFQAKDLLEALAVVEPISKECANIVRLHINAEMAISAESAEMGTARQTMPAEIEGTVEESVVEGFAVALNVRYLKDAIQSMHSETVYMDGNSDKKPVVFRPSTGHDYLHVVMPMHLD